MDPRAELMNLMVKGAMPSKAQQQLLPGASSPTNRDALIAQLVMRLLGRGNNSSAIPEGKDFSAMPEMPGVVGPHGVYVHPGGEGFSVVPERLSEGERFTPGGVTSGPKVATQADLSGLFSGRKEGTRVPGEKWGGPTMAQLKFLQAIRGSSLLPGESYGHYFPDDPGVKALAGLLGEPVQAPASFIGRTLRGVSKAKNPRHAMLEENSTGELGLWPDAGFSSGRTKPIVQHLVGLEPGAESAHGTVFDPKNPALLREILVNAIRRRN